MNVFYNFKVIYYKSSYINTGKTVSWRNNSSIFFLLWVVRPRNQKIAPSKKTRNFHKIYIFLYLTWHILGLASRNSLIKLKTLKSRGSVFVFSHCITRSIAITVPVRPTPAEQCNKIGTLNIRIGIILSVKPSRWRNSHLLWILNYWLLLTKFFYKFKHVIAIFGYTMIWPIHHLNFS